MLLDVRRADEYAAANEVISGSFWKDPNKIDEWIAAVPTLHPVVVYCARGGSVSHTVVDRLHQEGVPARYIEGGIEAWKAAGGKVDGKAVAGVLH